MIYLLAANDQKMLIITYVKPGQVSPKTVQIYGMSPRLK